MLYPILRPLLFSLEPETAHRLTLRGLDTAYRLGLTGLLRGGAVPSVPRRVMGLDFPNPVGLAGGLDKNGEHVDALGALGFGFIEVGTVTPRPQPGNPQPRLFRLPQAQAIINRMGFNNHGVDYLLQQVAGRKYPGVLGISIGKNKDTSMERAVDDYLIGLRKVYAVADYVAVNISSPNTKNLRDLLRDTELSGLLAALKAEQQALQERHGKYTPLVVKVAPDLGQEQIAAISQVILHHQVDGLIATNTTITRQGVEGLPHAQEEGGLSGAPLREKATQVVSAFCRHLNGQIPVIAAGGILTGQDAVEKVEAGASLVQIYTGLIYRGPGLVRELVQALSNRSVI